jgi:anti-anti-sigma factor
MLPAPGTPWRLEVRSVDGLTVARLVGVRIELHEDDALALRGRLLGLAAGVGAGTLLLDLGDVRYLTSTAVEVFLAVYRKLQAQGGRFSVCNPTPPVAGILDSLGLSDVLGVQPGPAGEFPAG